MQVEYQQDGFELFDEAIKEAEFFHQTIRRFVVNEKELIKFWYFLHPSRSTIAVKYGTRQFMEPVEQFLADEVQNGVIKLDYFGIPVVYKQGV